MSGDEEFGMQRLYFCRCARVVMARVAADMGHQHPHALAFECEEIRVDAACEPSVDVASEPMSPACQISSTSLRNSRSVSSNVPWVSDMMPMRFIL